MTISSKSTAWKSSNYSTRADTYLDVPIVTRREKKVFLDIQWYASPIEVVWYVIVWIKDVHQETEHRASFTDCSLHSVLLSVEKFLIKDVYVGIISTDISTENFYTTKVLPYILRDSLNTGEMISEYNYLVSYLRYPKSGPLSL